jgi:hypothetical protein
MNESKVWYSTLQFRFDPHRPSAGLLDLGFAVEFTTSTYWVVGLAVRATLDEKYVSGLDDLTRKLLEQRMAVLTREVDQTLYKAEQPGDALMILAARNPWSIHVTSPRTLTLTPSERKASDKATAEKLTEEYIFKIFNRETAAHHVPSQKQRQHPYSQTCATTDDEATTEGDTPWILPPKTVMRPLPELRA